MEQVVVLVPGSIVIRVLVVQYYPGKRQSFQIPKEVASRIIPRENEITRRAGKIIPCLIKDS